MSGKCLIDKDGQAHTVEELFPYDPMRMSEEAREQKSDDFDTLRALASAVQEALPELNTEQRATLCSRIAADFEGCRMQPVSFSYDDAGPTFHNMQANVSQLQDGFLDYIQSGCGLQSDYYTPAPDEQLQNDLKSFERSAKHQVYQTMALYGAENNGLTKREAEEVAVFSDALIESCSEHALYDPETSRNQGIKFRDFNLAEPYVCHTALPSMPLDHHMFGVREFEKAHLQGICARDFSEFEKPEQKPISNGREMRDLETAADEIEGRNSAESEADYSL